MFLDSYLSSVYWSSAMFKEKEMSSDKPFNFICATKNTSTAFAVFFVYSPRLCLKSEQDL